jgi:hypothetical protein
MAAARPSAYNTEIRVFILVLRRRRPLFSFPAGEVAGATRVVASTGLGEWHTPCRGSRIGPARLLQRLVVATHSDEPGFPRWCCPPLARESPRFCGVAKNVTTTSATPVRQVGSDVRDPARHPARRRSVTPQQTLHACAIGNDELVAAARPNEQRLKVKGRARSRESLDVVCRCMADGTDKHLTRHAPPFVYAHPARLAARVTPVTLR